MRITIIVLILIILVVGLFVIVNWIPDKYAIKEDNFNNYESYILVQEVHYTGTGWIQIGNENGYFLPEAYIDINLINGNILPKMEMYNEDYVNTFLCIVEHDPLGRLSKVTKDGEMLRTYGYDAFGNRTHMTEGDRETAYTYNAMNQLMSRMDSMSEETYAYDRRGNLSLIMENGSLKNSYTYGALNRLEQAVNSNGEAAAYEYNGLGHRVGKVVGSMKGPDGSYPAVQGMDIPNPMGNLKEQSLNPETKIRYTIDLTRGYHNLLEKEEAGRPTCGTETWQV